MEWILIAIILLFVAGLFVVPWLVRTYNRLVRGRNKVQELWSNIDVQLKRRHELVPNLVSTVKGYASHEEGVFTQVTEARSQAMSAKKPGQLGGMEDQLMAALANLYAVAENYPDLKASTNFSSLQQQLAQIENVIQEKRTHYNRGVSRFNTAVQSFPMLLIARPLGFKSFEFFGMPEDESQAPSPEF